MTSLARRIARGDWKHWARVIVLTLLGVYLGHTAEHAGFLIDLRYRLHQLLTTYVSTRPVHPRYTRLVTVNDEEYWRGDLAGRQPIKRDFLASLLRAVDQANPAVIALDFDLSASDPTSSAVHGDYRDETTVLMTAIREIASRRPIVLARTINRDGEGYFLEADIHDGDSRDGRVVCAKRPSDSTVPNVYCGYIALPRDIRRLPPALRMEREMRGVRLDSFALATARASSRETDYTRPIEVAYGSFMPFERYVEASAVASAGKILTDLTERRKLAHRIVLIGANWSSLGYGRGPGVDRHPSPVGDVPGVLLHANYVEAILDGRTYRPIPLEVAVGVEVVVVLAVALGISTRRKAAIWGLTATGLVAVWYVLFQNFGRFFDGLIPLIMVGSHAAFEQVREWRREALAARARVQQSNVAQSWRAST